MTFLSLNGQNKDYQEEVHLSLNTTNILVGETMYFSAFVYSNTSKNISRLSSILYVELIDASGKPIYQTKVGLRNGRGAGSIYINSNWRSGTYRVVAYTRWMRNYGSYFEQNILIFNPYNGELVQGKPIPGNPAKMDTALLPPINTYPPLQAISMNLGSLEPATLSIAVNKTKSLFYDNEVALKNTAIELPNYELLPEFNYALVQGTLKKQGALDGVRVTMSVKGSSMQVVTTKTDSLGRFWMNYNPDYAKRNGEIQIQLEEDTIAQIEVFSEFYDYYHASDTGSILLDSVTTRELITRSVHSQIQKAYQKSLPSTTQNHTIFTQANAEVFYLNDYKRFTSIRDTFIELINSVGVSKSEDNYRMIVRCERPQGLIDFDKPPLLLMDGIKVTAEDILKQSPNDIEKIEVIPAYYFINDLTYKGVISVHTFGRAKLSLKNPGQIFQLVDYQPYAETAEALAIDHRLPHYESDLYWKPIHTHTGGLLKVDFSTARLRGIYKISVSGITNTGKALNLTSYFEVLKEDQ